MSTIKTNLAKHNQEIKELINKKLDEYIPKAYPEKLWEAMRYCTLDGGKRVRALLCLESCKTFSGSVENALPTACAIEMIHAYSLVHDDLPCMDNDDFRRGKPSTHRQYGEDIAVLTGDALIPLAYETILTYTTSDVPDNKKLLVLMEFSKSIGANGLVGGQVVDMQSEGQTIDKETLHYIHSNKTGALIRFSARSGAILGGATETQLKAITTFSEAIGLAFQISDDLLDITSSKDTLGKTPGKDAATGKNTYPKLYGVDTSSQELNNLYNKAKAALLDNNIHSEILLELAEYIIKRVK